MATIRDGSVLHGLNNLARYGVGSSVSNPGPIAEIESFQGLDRQGGGFFPFHVKKTVFRLSGRGRLQEKGRSVRIG